MKSLQQVMQAWRALADSYRDLGEKKKALEIIEDLQEHSGNSTDLQLLRLRYNEHLRKWNSYVESARNRKGDRPGTGLRK